MEKTYKAWNKMDGAEQMEFCVKMAWNGKKKLEAQGSPAASLIKIPADAEALAGEIWLRVTEALTADPSTPSALAGTRAACAALEYDWYQERRHVAGSLDDPDYKLPGAQPAAEVAAIHRIEIAAILSTAADDLDRRILADAAAGIRQQTTAEALGIDRSNVSRRLTAIRARARAAIG